MTYDINGIDFETDAPAFISKPWLEACAASYRRRIGAITDYVYGNIKESYPGLARKGLEKKLGRPRIDAQSGTVTYARHLLGGEHIFSFQAAEDFRVLRYFTMDG